MNIGIVSDNIVEAFVSFWNSDFFYFIKILIAIYVIVLFVDIVLLLIVRGLGKDIEIAVKGTTMPLTSKKKMKKRWEKIEKRLNTNNLSQYKVAILEADNLVNEILIKIGYKGNNMMERLKNVDKNQIEEIDNLINSHQIRNKIIYDKNFIIEKEYAHKIIIPYRNFMEEFDII